MKDSPPCFEFEESVQQSPTEACKCSSRLMRLIHNKKIIIHNDDDVQEALRKVSSSNDWFLYESLLRYCSRSRDLSAGRLVHSHLREGSFRCDRYLSNLLVEMYGRCGSLDEAQHTFNTIRDPNVFSWTLLVAAYAENGHLMQAREVFDAIPRKDAGAWNTMMKLYTEIGDLDGVKEIFDLTPKRDVYSWTAMLSAYAQHGDINEAKKVFDIMPQRNIVSWNAMLAAYIQNGQLPEAEDIFQRIPRPDSISWNSMISAYAKLGRLDQAMELFERSPEKNVVTWNILLTSCMQENRLKAAKELFDSMEFRDTVSWNSMVFGYGQSGQVNKAKAMFDTMPERDPASWNSLLSAYTLNEQLEEARALFDVMPERDLVSWNALISGYAQNGYGKEAIQLFNKMLEDSSASPSKVTCISVLDACASSLESAEGRLMHAKVYELGVQAEVVVGNALINMYGKCGYLEQARKLLHTMPVSNSISWNTLLTAYAQSGKSPQTFELFRRMVSEGFDPTDVTFSAALSACSQSGEWSRALGYFSSMLRDFGLHPLEEQYGCLIDLLGRTGLLDEAEHLLTSTGANSIACMTLVGASGLHGDTIVGSRAACRASEYEPESSAPYVFLFTNAANLNSN